MNYQKHSKLIWDQVGDLMKAVDVAKSDPNSQTDEYKRGVANGLIRALSIMQGLEPEYIEPLAEMAAQSPPLPEDLQTASAASVLLGAAMLGAAS